MQICCRVKMIPWNVVNLSHLYEESQWIWKRFSHWFFKKSISLVKIDNFILRFHLYDGQITQVLFIINLTCSLCVALVWCLSSASGCGCALKCCTGLWFDWGRGSFACWLNGNGLSARPPLHKFPYGPEIVKYVFRSLKQWRFFFVCTLANSEFCFRLLVSRWREIYSFWGIWGP